MAKTRVTFVGNRKTKSQKKISTPIVSTSRTADTCADDCPLKGTGIEHKPSEGGTSCYATAKPGGGKSIFQNAESGDDTQTAMKKIDVMAAPKAAVRHLVSGDVAGENDDYVSEANAMHARRPDLQGWGYTHHWRQMQSSDAQGWTLNASTETPKQAEEAISKGWQAVIESPADKQLAGTRIAGRRVVTCPNALNKDVGCADCHLCRNNSSTRPVVEFPIHGNTNIVGGIVNKIREQESVTSSARPDGDSTDRDSTFLGMPTMPSRTQGLKSGWSDGRN